MECRCADTCTASHKEAAKAWLQSGRAYCGGIGRHMDIPVDPTLLIRSENTTPMKELNDTERRKNVKKAFNIRKNVVRYKKVLIVDDIYTTGATIDECARVLLEHGAEEVYFLCLCIGKGL
jgi:ComF family protein